MTNEEQLPGNQSTAPVNPVVPTEPGLPAPPPSPTALPDEAIRQLEESLRTDPGYDELWGNLGDLYVNLGRSEDAEAAFAMAALLDPRDSEWAYKRPNLARAADALRKIGFMNDDWVGGLADSVHARGHGEVAERLYRLAADIDPNDSEWWLEKLAAFAVATNPRAASPPGERIVAQPSPQPQVPPANLGTLPGRSGGFVTADSTGRPALPPPRPPSLPRPQDLYVAELAPAVASFNAGAFDTALSALAEIKTRMETWNRVNGRRHSATDSVTSLINRVLDACRAWQIVSSQRSAPDRPACVVPRLP